MTVLGVSPQSVQEASCSDFSSPASPATPQPLVCHSNPDPDDYLKGLELARLEETHAEPDYDGDSDYEDAARERELMLDDLATYNDDFSRSNDEGWFYSDEN